MFLFRLLPLFLSGSRPWRLGLALLGCLGLATTTPAVGQGAPFQLERAKARRVKLPFLLQRNLMVVSTHLNGQGPYNFVLDSGVGTAIITDPALRSLLKLRAGQVYQLVGAGEMEEPLVAYISDSVRVTMPGVVCPLMSFFVLSEDVLDLSGYVGMPIHGLLGFDVFRSFAVEVHPEENEMTLHRPATYQAPRGRRWTSVPLELDARRAYITTQVDITDSLRFPLKLLLDTGGGHALSIETESDVRLKLPAQHLRAQLGRGLSGNINGYLGRVPAIQLGRYKVPSLLASFPDNDNMHARVQVPRNGNVGFELLKRFNMVIDYPHNRLLLRPNSFYRDPFEHDMSGIELLAVGADYRRYLILKVLPDSPAAAAGLHPDDELISINLLPTEALTLSQVSRLLHSADNRQLLLIVRRPDGELFTTSLRLKRKI